MALGTPVNQGHNQASSGSTSLAVTTLATIATGDFILVFGGYSTGGTGVSSIVDPSGNAYTIYDSVVTGTGGQCVAWTIAAPGFAAGTVTVNFSGAGARHAAQVFSWTGGWTTPAAMARDNGMQIHPAFVSGTSAPGTTGPCAQANNMFWSSLYAAGTDPGTYTPGGSFTNLGGTTVSTFMKFAYLINSSGNPLAVSPSWVNSVGTGSNFFFGFRAAAPTQQGEVGGLSGVGQ